MVRALLFVLAIAVPASAFAGGTLFDAVKSGDAAAVEQMLADGAAVDVRGPDNGTPLIAAALGGQTAVVELLLSKGADVTARNAGGFTPLHAAAYSGSVAVAKLLLDNKAVLEDAENKAGVTPMFVAAEMNHPEVVELLIAKGADAHRPEAHGYSAMTRAIFKRHWDMVSLLKRHGLKCQQDKLSIGEFAQCLVVK
jgi:uncharacterized protein